MRPAAIALFLVMACGSKGGPRLDCPAGTRLEKNEYARGCKLPDGTWHGPFAALRDSGKARNVGRYNAGVPDGTWTAYGPDGTVLGTYAIVDGTGTQRHWHDNGQLATEIPYKDGRREGLARCVCSCSAEAPMTTKGRSAQSVASCVKAARWARVKGVSI